MTVVIWSGKSVHTNMGSLKNLRSCEECCIRYLYELNTFPSICTNVSMDIRTHGITRFRSCSLVRMEKSTAAWPISNVHASMTARSLAFASPKNEKACMVDTSATLTYSTANRPM